MVEPTGHCPYLGLKQNRAIRFSSPTPEHRCYVGGEPIEIPVDQASFCLSRGHVNCPLYMGLTIPTTAAPVTAAGVQVLPAAGMRGWLTSLPPRDRAVYALMIGMLALIVLIYLAAGIQSLGQPSAGLATVGPSVPATPSAGVAIDTPIPPASTSVPEPSATNPPSATAEPSVTAEPTTTPVPPSAIPASPSAVPAATAPIVMPTAEASATPTAAPPTTRPTRSPAQPARTTQPAEPSPAPPANTSTEMLWLYFADQSGSLYVPVQRSVKVQDKRVAEAAVRELISGPRDGLARLILPDTKLLDLTIRDGTAFVNFDRMPGGAGDERGLYSIVLSLTQFQSVRQVQILVNGQATSFNNGAPVIRPVVNPLNPDKLAFDYRSTEFLPLYFPTAEGGHDVRIIRMVPKTRETAAGTMLALLDGPGEYAEFVQEVIPDGTALIGVQLNEGIATVNLSAPFGEAGNRDAAVRTIVESLTTLPSVTGVRFEVEGQSLGGVWGERYGQVFPRSAINPE